MIGRITISIGGFPSSANGQGSPRIIKQKNLPWCPATYQRLRLGSGWVSLLERSTAAFRVFNLHARKSGAASSPFLFGAVRWCESRMTLLGPGCAAAAPVASGLRHR